MNSPAYCSDDEDYTTVRHQLDNAKQPMTTGGHREYQIECRIKGTLGETNTSSENDSDKQEKQYRVLRRFKDFRQLQQLLRSKYLETIVPPLPKKSIRDKVSQDQSAFVEKRKYSLLLFLNKVAEHLLLSQTEEFFEFLTDQKYYHQNQDESGLTGRLKSIWNCTPNLTNIITSKQTKKPEQMSQNIIADIKLEQEYQISVVNNSQYISSLLEKIEQTFKKEVQTQTKRVGALSKLNSLFSQINELDNKIDLNTDGINSTPARQQNDIFYTDTDDFYDTIKHFHFESIGEVSLLKNDMVIETMTFYKRYLESLAKSFDLRQRFIDGFYEKQGDMTIEKKKQNLQRIKDITRGHIDEYQRLTDEIQVKIINCMDKMGKHFSALFN